MTATSSTHLRRTTGEGGSELDGRFRKPEGEIGIETLKEMNEHHRPLSEWALSNLPEMTPDSILDIGCGGGMMISLLHEKYSEALIAGIDISDTAVEFAREKNRELINEGKCRIDVASVEDIPYDEFSFDLVVSCESYFFWPDIIRSMEEACRVVAFGGRILIVSEAYPHPDFDAVNEEHSAMYGMKLRTNDYMKALIGSFGFEVEVITVEEKNWVMFVGKKNVLSSF